MSKCKMWELQCPFQACPEAKARRTLHFKEDPLLVPFCVFPTQSRLACGQVGLICFLLVDVSICKEVAWTSLAQASRHQEPPRPQGNNWITVVCLKRRLQSNNNEVSCFKALESCRFDSRVQEKALRELAAEALALLVPRDPALFADKILPQLIASTLSADLPQRHGATLAVGEVLVALKAADVELTSGKLVFGSSPSQGCM